MIPYVHDRLGKWGEWSMARADGGACYMAAQLRYEERVGGATSFEAASVILANSPALEMEMGVARLRQAEPMLGELVCLFYRDDAGCKADAIAEACHCSVRTMWYRIDKSHVWLLDWLNGRAIGEDESGVRAVWQEWAAKQPRVVGRAA